MTSSDSASKSPAQDHNRVVVPHKPKWHQRLAAALIYGLTRAVSASIRYEWRDEVGSFTRTPRPPGIYCVWHNRLALCLEIYRLYVCRLGPPGRLAAMVSASKDGGLLAGVLELNGVEPVRGSTSRRGRQALLELVTWAERGYDLAITPDGPRGPSYVVQDGVIALAQLTGLPIVPVSYHLRWRIRLKSWDRFQIPLPFSPCIAYVGEPLHVPRETTDEERERLRKTLEERLRSITRDF